MIKKELKPKIRFNGCEDELIENPIGNIGSISMCKRVFKYQTSDKGEVPFFKIGTFGGVPDAFISRELYEELKNKYKYPKEGAILISASGTIGKTVEYCGKDEYFQDSNIIWIDHNEEIIDKYIKYYIQIINWYGLEGSTIKRLYNNNILKSIIKYPKDIKEQTNIGEFFDKIDKSIKQSEEKVEKWKNIRTSLLSKMFPKEGKKVPELRFKGFSGEWEEKKLGDIVIRLDNLRIPVAEKERIKGKTPYYGANGIQDYVKGYTHSGQNILIAEDGANSLNDYPVIYVEGNIWVNNHAHVVTSIDKTQYNNSFIAIVLKKIKYDTFVSGSSRFKLTSNSLMSIKVKIPSIEEQVIIGSMFNYINSLIKMEKERINTINQLKSTFLNKMFV